jgi:chromosomal replication initiation ATPase DnaA
MNTLKVLREEVNRKTGLDITKSTRERPYAYSRFLYYKLAKELTPAGFSDIAKSVGVTHATVIHVKVINMLTLVLFINPL